MRLHHHLRRARAGGVALSVLGALLLVPAAPAAAHTTADNRISTSRMTADKTYQLFTVLPDGSSPRQLTFGGRNKCDPAMSPLRDLVAFSHGNRISVVPTDGSGVEQPVVVLPADEYVRGPAWSPDGQTIVYMASVGYQGGASSSYRTAVFAVTRSGSGWSSPELWAWDATGPRFSPKGDQLVLSIGTIGSSERDLHLMDVASKVLVQQVTALPGNEATASWHPTTPGLLLFTTCAKGVHTVQIGQAPVRVGTLSACDVSWESSSGKRLVLHSSSNLSVYDTTTGRTAVVDRKANDRQPDW